VRGQGHWLHLQRGDRAVMPAAVTEGGGFASMGLWWLDMQWGVGVQDVGWHCSKLCSEHALQHSRLRCVSDQCIQVRLRNAAKLTV
jgi:hypothetical protein